ncbi:MAG: hypothetical protein DRN30_06110 [Thermoplasmata archaeon]|nr:MAG: hypothetical protein DRN30_06110 [Thermoplasmata archaeon]
MKQLRHVTKRGFYRDVEAKRPWIECIFNDDGTYVFSDHNIDTKKMVENETYRELDRNEESGHIQIEYYNAEVRDGIWRTVPLPSVKLVAILNF